MRRADGVNSQSRALFQVTSSSSDRNSAARICDRGSDWRNRHGAEGRLVNSDVNISLHYSRQNHRINGVAESQVISVTGKPRRK